MEMRLDGQTALITGGSRGIGKAIAESFAHAGASIMLVSRKPEGLEAAAAELIEATGADVAWHAGNTGDIAVAEAACDATIERFGSIDILVNNAATNPYAGPTIDVDLPRWDKTIQVNLTAPMFWTQTAWRRWMKDHGGNIINISSVGGLTTNPVIGVYDMTKSALIHLTEQLAAELAPTARVNAICPGLVKTDFARLLWEGESGDRVAQSYPMKRLGEVTDIANAALYLASDASSWMTGQHLVLDGGGQVAFSSVG